MRPEKMTSVRKPRNGRTEQNPSFQFYPGDFLSSDAVALMSNAEVGVYIKLLSRSWMGPGLPTDTKKLARLVGESHDDFVAMWESSLSECFEQRGELLCNPRQERERDHLETFKAERAEAGRKGAEARWAPKSGQQMAKNGSAMAQPSESDAVAMQQPMANDGPLPIPSHPIPSQPSTTTPLPPEGGSADKPRRKPTQKVDALERALRAEPGLPEDVETEARAFRDYRKDARHKAYAASTWQAQLAYARKDPDAVVAAWAEARLRGWQGPRIKEHVEEGRALSATGTTGAQTHLDPRHLSFRVQDELLGQKRRSDLQEWAERTDREAAMRDAEVVPLRALPPHDTGLDPTGVL